MGKQAKCTFLKLLPVEIVQLQEYDSKTMSFTFFRILYSNTHTPKSIDDIVYRSVRSNTNRNSRKYRLYVNVIPSSDILASKNHENLLTWAHFLTKITHKLKK